MERFFYSRVYLQLGLSSRERVLVGGMVERVSNGFRCLGVNGVAEMPSEAKVALGSFAETAFPNGPFEVIEKVFDDAWRADPGQALDWASRSHQLTLHVETPAPLASPPIDHDNPRQAIRRSVGDALEKGWVYNCVQQLRDHAIS